jgi:hypothetical protein
VHYDPSQDGADVGFTVLDRLRAEMLHRVGFSDLLKPAKQAWSCRLRQRPELALISASSGLFSRAILEGYGVDVVLIFIGCGPPIPRREAKEGWNGMARPDCRHAIRASNRASSAMRADATADDVGDGW